MPTPHKNTANMKKHLTKAEKQAREKAEQQLVRKKRVYIRTPEWLTGEARKLFHRTKRDLAGLNLLDNVDTELLGLYAEAAVQARPGKGTIKERQAWYRIASSYAEKLGISAAARARLARKAAEEIPPDDFEELFDNVSRGTL